MYQRIVIVGRLGADPEMRYTPSGDPVTTFRVATNRRYTDREGNSRDETTWFRVTAWRRLAETCNQYLAKGRLVLVDGRLNPDQSGNPRVWTGKDGVARASYELTATTVKFLSPRGEPVAEFGPGEELPEDEIPF
ncbi:MAG: single-stranded DNA-binding protein [Anaerolineae bacterium]